MNLAVAIIGFKPDDFWSCRPAYFFGILNECLKQKQNEFRNKAELIRLQTTKLVNMSGRSLKDGETLKPEDLWKYDWDQPEITPLDLMTDEQIAEHNARLFKAMK